MGVRLKTLPGRGLAIVSGLLLLVLLALPATTAFAHERRTIANGKYDVVVGWDIEPTFVGSTHRALEYWRW